MVYKVSVSEVTYCPKKNISVTLKKIEAMNQSYDTTTPEGKSQVIEAYREAVESDAGLSLKAFCDRLGLSDGYNYVRWWADRHGIYIYEIQRWENSGRKSQLC